MKTTRAKAFQIGGKRAVPVRADRQFWRNWHGDRLGMLAVGYRVRKVGGRWRAFKGRAQNSDR